jgi:hypothetical protein
MASDKKRYTVNGVRYNIPKDEVKGFLKSNPNAIPVNSYMHNDSIYHVPMNDLDGFLQAKPDAKLVEGSKKKVSTPLAVQDALHSVLAQLQSRHLKYSA